MTSYPQYSDADLTSLGYALNRDSACELKQFRDEFFIPKFALPEGSDVETAINPTGQMVYLCGNSLGLQPKLTQKLMMQELTKWQEEAVEGHFIGERPWTVMDEKLAELGAPIVGAKVGDEVAIMNTLSANLHLLMLSFYQPNEQRSKILMENGAFCSDNHIVRSQLRFHGRNQEEDLILISPREGEHTIRHEDIIAAIEKDGDKIALVILPGIQYYTGQIFDMKAITVAAQAKGCVVGFDLAHAAGNINLELHNWGVDFAVWCNYKYLNSGPGAIGGAFVHSKFFNPEVAKNFFVPTLPKPITEKRLDGWWGQKVSDRFAMRPDHVPFEGAQGWIMSNPPVTSLICIESSFLMLEKMGGVAALRKKSIQVTHYLEALLNHHIVGKPNAVGSEVYIITPTDPEQRGAQISIEFSNPIVEIISEKLIKAGVICDERKPKVIRISPAPSYNNFADCYRAVLLLKQILSEPL